MKSRNWFMAGLALLTVLLCLAATSWAAGYFGLPVTQVVLKDNHGGPWPEPERLLPLVLTKPGAPLTGADVRKSIEYLYLKGLFQDVRVEAFPEGEGVRVEYLLAPITVVDKISITGNRTFSNYTIKETIPDIEGKELREELFPDLRAAIQALYQSEGYYGIKVRFDVQELDRPHRVRLALQIVEGQQTIIEDIRFSGNAVLSGEELLSVMKIRKGKPLKTEVLFDHDLKAILKLYTAAGYPAAQPGPVRMSFTDGKAYLEVMGAEGPKVTVRFSGNKAMSGKKLRQLMLIWQEHDVSDAIIESSAEKIKNTYRDAGYADVKVDVIKRMDDGSIDLTFVIAEGPRLTVRQIVTEGNQAFSAKELTGQMFLRRSGWFISRPYREDLLERDVDNIKDRYAEAGYLDAGIDKKIIRSDNGKEVTVYLRITEGIRTMVDRLSFEGNRIFSEQQLLDKLNLKAGMPFTERIMEEDRYRILSAYTDQGFLYTRVDVEKRPLKEAPKNGIAANEQNGKEELVEVRYRIAEDRQVTIGKVILRGNELTRDHVFLRELLAREGDPYRYGDILLSQQRIYRLGYIGQARFEPVRPGEKEYVADMLLTVSERNAGAVEFGVGYGQLDRFRYYVEPSYRNLSGEARYASLRYEESDVLHQATFQYRQPWFFERRIEAKFTLLWSDVTKLNINTREIYYQTRKTAASYGLEKVYDEGLKLSLTYQFENVENYNVLQEAARTPEDIGRVRISSLSPGIIYDKRDDAFNPRKGSLHGANIKEAMPSLGSSVDFTKVTAQSTWFFGLPGDTIAALSGRAGMAWPHRETTEIPIHERFTLGGSTTVRGYTQDSVGPSSETTRIPTGGSSMALFNAEMRFNPTEGFGIVLFVDAGNVWVDQHIRLNDLRASYGAGLRYGTPVGPLRLDYGQKINRRSGESPGELHFSIGHAF